MTISQGGESALGIMACLLGGMMNSTWPLFTKVQAPRLIRVCPEGGWQWENCWLLFSILFVAVNLSYCVGMVGWSTLMDVYRNASSADVGLICMFSFLWGAGTMFYSVGVKLLGAGIGIALVMSLLVVIGTILPLVEEDLSQITSPTALVTLGGLVLAIIGFCCSAYSSTLTKTPTTTTTTTTKGLTPSNSNSGKARPLPFSAAPSFAARRLNPAVILQASSHEGPTASGIWQGREHGSGAVTDVNGHLNPTDDDDDGGGGGGGGAGVDRKGSNSVLLGDGGVGLGGGVQVVNGSNPNPNLNPNPNRSSNGVSSSSSSSLAAHTHTSNGEGGGGVDVEMTHTHANGNGVVRKEGEGGGGDGGGGVDDGGGGGDGVDVHDVDVSKKEDHSKFVGVVVCVAGAICSSMLQFAFVFGGDLIDYAEDEENVSSIVSPLVIWFVAFSLQGTFNIGYACYLLTVNNTWRLYTLEGGCIDVSLQIWQCLTMAVLFVGHIQLYGVGQSLFNDLGPVIAWPLIMSSTVLSGQVWGIVLNEWEGASAKAKQMNGISICLLLVAVTLIAIAGAAL